MQALNFPEYTFNIKQESNNRYIFDEIRKKYLVLTPEEWVRQHVVKFLICEKKYPPGRIAIETGLKVHQTSKRSDVVVYNSNAQPFIVVECKAPEVKITQKVFEQIAAYNIQFKAPLLFVTNGLDHFYCYIDLAKKKYSFIKDLPLFTNQ